MSFLKVIDSRVYPTDFPPTTSAMEFKYKLDAFQQHAVMAISRGENVLITAKTGSGKTFVGEYQIAESLRKGKKVFYTTPIKSLSNQKFHDLKELFGEDSVGIMTGDIKFKPDAPIIVMTTEILRNLLYKKDASTKDLGISAQLSIDELDAVIFDEVHYINNADRGTVWEETIILLPSHINLVLLSATISEADVFADWIGNLKHKPINLISTIHRVVPLVHYAMTHDGSTDMKQIMDAKNRYDNVVYKDWYKYYGTRGETSFVHRLNTTMRWMEHRNMLPSLNFIFSLRGCEKYASAIEGTYLDSSEVADVKHIFSFHLHSHRERIEHLEQYHVIYNLLQRGIAFHHSGLHPQLKEIVELLFSRGFVKILFCTETFSVGINMPTKSVVFLDFKKHDKIGLRMLYPDEYMQMAGRAGRRGKDDRGYVLYLPSREAATPDEVRAMMTGACASVESKMNFKYEFILKTLQAGGIISWKTILYDSYWCKQKMTYIETIESNISKLEAELASIIEPSDVTTALDERERLENAFKVTPMASKKDAQRTLDQWRGKHMHPSWETAWKNRRIYTRITSDINALRSRIEIEMKSIETPIKKTISFLITVGFLKPESNTIEPDKLTSEYLTELGVISTEINEGHPLLMSELYCSGLLSTLTVIEICSVLACFTHERGTDEDEMPSVGSLDVSDAVKTVLKHIDNKACEYTRIGLPTDDDFWKLSTSWIEPVTKWVSGEDGAVICTTYEIYSGKFIRTMLKMANLMEELERIATYKRDIELLDKIKNVNTLIVRDLVMPDSLYLR